MSDDLHKFMFLGAIIAIAVFSNRDLLYGQKFAIADVNPFTQKSAPAVSRVEPPRFIPDYNKQKTVIKNSGGDKIISVGDSITPNAAPSSSPVTALGWQLAVVSENSQLSYTPEGKLSPALESPDMPQLSFKKAGNDDPPQVGANVVLVADLKSGEEFFSLGKEKRWPIASITKLMTAAVVSKEFAFNQSITLQAADFSAQSSGTIMKVGERFTVADLMSAMLLKSRNESAEALARIYSNAQNMGEEASGRDNFISAMNQRAALLGVPDAHFDDPTGLSPTNQSTAPDLRRLALSIYEQYPDIFRTTRKLSAYITELD